MATEGAELIDIYSEDEFNQNSAEEVEFTGREEPSDLYDDVLTGTVARDRPLGEGEAPPPGKGPPPKAENKPAILYTYSGGRSKRLAVYVGNFSWWTTDRDLMDAALAIGVKDIQEIKFAENRANGQSKGYAEMVVSSESSLQRLLESLPQCEVNGERVDCRFATRQNFSLFETQAKRRVPQRSQPRDSLDFGDSRPPGSSPDHHPHPPPHPHPHPPSDKPSSLPPPFYSRPPPFAGDLPRPFHPPPGLPPPPPPMPPLPHLYHPPPPHLPSQAAPTMHLNPAFFPPTPDGYSQPAHSNTAYTRHREGDAPTAPLTDTEVEELLNRNRAIASSAMAKAVSGASSGDFPVAIETLLTAIAVIKQSRVCSDERCRALVTSLKDCLYSIETRSYGSRKRHRSRDRDRERDRDRDRERDRDRDRERDRDRDREREREGSHSQPWDGGSRRHRERSLSGERERHREHRDRHR